MMARVTRDNNMCMPDRNIYSFIFEKREKSKTVLLRHYIDVLQLANCLKKSMICDKTREKRYKSG